MDRKRFPADLAIPAMGPNSRRYAQHRATGKVFLHSAVHAVHADHVAPEGMGRGAVVHFTAAAVLQGAIALRLIDSGVSVEDAYVIGARFAFMGEGARGPGCLFSDGDTWLIVEPQRLNALGREGFEFATDADPAFATLAGAALTVGEPRDGAPRVVLNLSDVCRAVAEGLGLNPFTAFSDGAAA